MNWFSKEVKRKLERQGYRVMGSDNFTFDFVSINQKGKKVGIKCKPHGHVYAPERRELLKLSHSLCLDSVYVASAKYVSDPKTHDIKIEKIK